MSFAWVLIGTFTVAPIICLWFFKPYKKKHGLYIELTQRQAMNSGDSKLIRPIKVIEDGYVYYYSYCGVVYDVKVSDAKIIKFEHGIAVALDNQRCYSRS